MRFLFFVPLIALFAGCSAKEVDCGAFVAKLASLQPKVGEPEKKLYRKMCDDLPQSVRACVVGAKAQTDVDACVKDVKLR
jgi:hypothetical protein